MSGTTHYTEIRDGINCLQTLYHETASGLIQSMKWGSCERILDYGCGTGDFAKRYLFPIAEKHDSKIFGVDICKRSIAEAKKSNAHKCIEYYTGDIVTQKLLDWPFEMKEMNKIVSVFVIPYIPDTREMYKRFLSALIPGGQFGLIYATGRSYKIATDVANLEKWKNNMVQQANISSWAEWTSENESEITPQSEILNSCGFMNTVNTAKEYTLQFEKCDHLFEFLATIHPILNQLPWDSKHDNFDCEIKKELWSDFFSATQKEYPTVDLQSQPLVLDTVIVHRIISEKPNN